MALQSDLFRGDPKLEAAAVSDPAHILPGANGPHVGKIQTALIQLDGAAIVQDSFYGPLTADAVLAYKRKRKIINFSYQTQADNIVGKLTIAALDSELLSQGLPVPPPPGLPPLTVASVLVCPHGARIQTSGGPFSTTPSAVGRAADRSGPFQQA